MRSINLLLSLLPLVASRQSIPNYAQYVNPFMGSEGPTGVSDGGGDIFVGGARPFGVVKVGIDTTAAGDLSKATLNGGWTPDGNMTAVSMMHESGTGGGPKYGTTAQMPLTSVAPPVNILDNTTYMQPRIGHDVASLGYFKTVTANGVTTEISASRHAGIMQYTYPAGEKHVLVDVSHLLPNGLGNQETQSFIGGEITIESNGKAYSGYGTYAGGWNVGAPWTVYFYGEFQEKPTEAKVFRGKNTQPSARFQTQANGPVPVADFPNAKHAIAGPLNDRIGALFSWIGSSSTQVVSRVGISFISTAKAKAYIASEIPSWVLTDTVEDAVREWNKDVFSKIQVDTSEAANQTNLALLYSSLYFMHLMPSDRTGENPLWDSGEPYWDDFYTIWDIFRCTTSLYHLIQPIAYEGMVRALIDIYRWQGYMPDGRSGNWNGNTQGGSNADNVLADAFVKSLPNINWTDGYAAMKKDAEVLPYNTFNLADLTGCYIQGRGALDDWLQYGYLTIDNSTRSLSRTVEYSLNDYSLSIVAASVAPSEVHTYLNRSRNWKNLWNPDIESLGFNGFLAPRFANGSWDIDDYDPLKCGGCEQSSITYEGVPWEYSMTVPHDMSTLISFMGGADTFERRIDTMFIPGLSAQDLADNGPGITTIMNIGNEPDFATPYLYNYINKQYKSVNASRSLGTTYFKDAYYGVPGNSDAGAMNSWMVWQMLGLYPIVTQPLYLLESPWFSDINMTVNGNSTLRITVQGMEEGFYVQSVKVNGAEWGKNWVEHDEVMVKGGRIDFVVGKDEKIWETGDVPPSPGAL